MDLCLKKKKGPDVIWKENALKYAKIHVFFSVSSIARASPMTYPLPASEPPDSPISSFSPFSLETLTYGESAFSCLFFP